MRFHCQINPQLISSPTRRRESVCRNLFGPVDHSQLRRDLKLKLKEIIEQDRRRWNFNFECETPLPGRFQWEEAARPKDAAHRSGGDRPSDGEDGAGTDQENCSNITNKRKSPTEEMLHRLSKPAATFVCWLIDKCNAKILTNLLLRFSDYFAKRRRTTTTKSIPNHFHVGSNEAALRKTLR
uniref:Cyclin-dependent kinase inhibitor domain-containing protein n=1 Tax=Haplochromis burtoni TaxID=8153 RepID=A0A3Q2V7Y2_HAPBU